MKQSLTLGAVIGGVGTLLLMAQDNRNADREFRQTVKALRANGAVVDRYVPTMGQKKWEAPEDIAANRNLATLVQLEGVNPTSTDGLAMIYDAICNPANEKNLYGRNPADCDAPTLKFTMPGIKGGYIQLRLPTNDY